MVKLYTAWSLVGTGVQFTSHMPDWFQEHSGRPGQLVVTPISLSRVVYRSGLRGARSVWSGGRQVAEEAEGA